jgi:hypothetical protein
VQPARRPAARLDTRTGLGESALFHGHLLGELVRRVDGRMPGEHWAQEVCGPLGLDFSVGLDASQQARAVDLTGLTPAYREQLVAERPALYVRALSSPPGAQDADVVNGARWRAAQVPAVNGHGTARAVAGLYAALLQGQLLDGAVLAEATSPQASGFDQVLGVERTWASAWRWSPTAGGWVASGATPAGPAPKAATRSPSSPAPSAASNARTRWRTARGRCWAWRRCERLVQVTA